MILGLIHLINLPHWLTKRRKAFWLSMGLLAWTFTAYPFTVCPAASSPRLKATIRANGSVFIEHGPRVVLTFNLTNIGKQAADSGFGASRLFVNGKETPEWRTIVVEMGTPLPRIKAGAHWKIDSRLSDVDRVFRRPGVYTVRWTGPHFGTRSLRLRVLPDRRKAKEPATTTLLRRIRAQLPTGWHARYDPQEGSITVVRLKPTSMEPLIYPGGGNPMVEDPPRDEQFTILLQLEPAVTPRNYAAVKAKNAIIWAQLDRMENRMLHIPRAKTDFLPRTPQERVQVAQYEKLKKTLVWLPTHHFGDLGLIWGDGFREEYDYERVVNTSVQNECAGVARFLQKLLTPYEPEPQK